MSTEPDGTKASFKAKLGSLVARGRRVTSSESVAGAARLASGTAAGQIVLVAVTPILTRIYSPADFGALAVFVSLVGLVLAVSAGGYNFAIMLPEKREDASAVVALSLVLVAITSVLTGLVAIAFLVFGVFTDSLGPWILLWPLAVLFGGAAQVLVANAVRYGRYGVVAGATLIKSVVTGATQIVLGLLGAVTGGLIAGHFLGMASANLRLARPVVADLKQDRPSKQEIRAAAGRYSQFPKHTVPAVLVNTGFLSGTPLVIGWLFGTITLGFWSLANSFAYMPTVLVSQAVGQVYYRKAVAVRHSVQEAKRLFDRTVASLAAVSFLPFAVMAWAAPDIFAFVFGEEWRVAGQYAQVMMPAVWVRFVAAPVASTTMAHERNRVLVFTSSLQIVAVAISVAATSAWDLPVIGFLILLSALLALVQAVSLVMFRRTIGRAPLEPTALASPPIGES